MKRVSAIVQGGKGGEGGEEEEKSLPVKVKERKRLGRRTKENQGERVLVKQKWERKLI